MHWYLSTSPHNFCRKWIGAIKENSYFDLRVLRANLHLSSPEQIRPRNLSTGTESSHKTALRKLMWLLLLTFAGTLYPDKTTSSSKILDMTGKVGFNLECKEARCWSSTWPLEDKGRLQLYRANGPFKLWVRCDCLPINRISDHLC